MDEEEPSIEEKPFKESALWTFADRFSAEDVKSMITQITDNSYKIAQLRFQEHRKISWPIWGLIGIIFISVTLLAYLGIIEGNHVTSLGGVIVGYLLNYLGEKFRGPPNTT